MARKHFDATLTRAKFNELTADLVDATMRPVNRPADAGLNISQIDKILLLAVRQEFLPFRKQSRIIWAKSHLRASTPTNVSPLALLSKRLFLAGKSRIFFA